MASQRLRRLWITSFRTEETQSSSGTSRTGRRCVRSATTGRPEERTAIRRIDTESVEAGGGHDPENQRHRRPAPPLALIFAKFAPRGQRAVRWIPKKLQYFLKPQVKRGNKRFFCGFFVRGSARLASDFRHGIQSLNRSDFRVRLVLMIS